MTNHNKLLLALVFGSMSYSATAKVYSWRGADGAMHYSQFPRELVEKNSAQSRESRNIEDLADVVDELDDQSDSNLLDGLDDIVASASAVREKDKVLKRTDPELLLAAQVSALESQSSPEKPRHIAATHDPAETVVIIESRASEKVATRVKPQNRFLAGIKSKLNGRPAASRRNVNSPATASATPSADILSAQSKDEPVTRVANMPSEKQQVQNKFLAEINKKLFRARLVTKGDNQNEVDQMLSQNKTEKNIGNHIKVNGDKDLSRSADKIKIIERQVEVKAVGSQPQTPRLSNSALMLSRLSSNHVGRLPLAGAGTDQLDRQGIDSVNPFVNDINRTAE